MGARGTEDRYDGTISFNKFKGDQRISVIGGLNNINKSTFSFSDIVSTMGGFGARGNGGGGGGFTGGGGGGGFNGGGGNGGGIAAVVSEDLVEATVANRYHKIKVNWSELHRQMGS